MKVKLKEWSDRRPIASLHEPEQKPVALDLVHGAAPLIEVVDHDRDGVAAEEDAVVVEAEAPGDEVEAGVDVLARRDRGRLESQRVSCRAGSRNLASPVRIVLTLRSNQSRLKL